MARLPPSAQKFFMSFFTDNDGEFDNAVFARNLSTFIVLGLWWWNAVYEIFNLGRFLTEAGSPMFGQVGYETSSPFLVIAAGAGFSYMVKRKQNVQRDVEAKRATAEVEKAREEAAAEAQRVRHKEIELEIHKRRDATVAPTVRQRRSSPPPATRPAIQALPVQEAVPESAFKNDPRRD